MIQSDSLKTNVSFLANDVLEGRRSGKTGQRLASNYVANKFQSYGVQGYQGKYFQQFTLIEDSWKKITFQLDSTFYLQGNDYFCYNESNFSAQIEANNLLFLGYGIEEENYNDYQDIDVTGKVLIVFEGEPTDLEGNYLIHKNGTPSAYSYDWRLKATKAKAKGAKALIICSNAFNFDPEHLHEPRSYMQEMDNMINNEYVNTFFISPRLANIIFANNQKVPDIVKNAIHRAKHSNPITLFTKLSIDQRENTKMLQTENTFAFVEGSSKSNETIVLTAHIDHLGKDKNGTYNGADDNASGVAALMEAARIMELAKKRGHGPKRNLLFLLVTGEEEGLLGSMYYANHPIIPMSNTYANINIDMLGRSDPNHAHNKKYCYIIDSFNDKGKLFTKTAKDISALTDSIKLDETYNNKEHPAQFYRRSDQHSFALKGVPFLVFSSGLHHDYHEYGDTAEKIDYELLKLRTQLIFRTVWEMAQ